MSDAVRPQYHFRPAPEGLLAWDVRRLIALSAKFEVRQIQITTLKEVDENWWYDRSTPTVRSIVDHMRLVRQADLGYPILLCADGGLMDGMHRVARALLAGRETIAAKQFAVTPSPDYVGVDPDDLPYDP